MQDQLSIETPEMVALEFPVAGLGSRALAVAIDSCLQAAGLILILVLAVTIVGRASPLGRIPPLWADAVVILIPFLLQWGYFALFEGLWNGQTPGKRLVKLRVIEQGGRSLTFFESLTRNFLRAVDMLPGFYAVGVVSMLLTRRQQRLGDLAASTLVIHERALDEPVSANAGARILTAFVFDAPPSRAAAFEPHTLPADAVARLGEEDLRTIENFLVRRLDLSLDARAGLAEKIAAHMRAQTGLQTPETMSTETFLEQLATYRRDLRSGPGAIDI